MGNPNFTRIMRLPAGMFSGMTQKGFVFAMPQGSKWEGWTFPFPHKLTCRTVDNDFEVLYTDAWTFPLRNPKNEESTCTLGVEEMERELSALGVDVRKK